MENTFKMKSLSLLLKINIWTAFFVLLAGIVIIAGCSLPQGGDTKDEQVIEKPTNPTKSTDPTVDPDDPTNNPDDPTVDPDNPTIDPDDPTVDPDDPTVDPNDPTIDPDNPTVDPDNPTVDPDDPVIYGEEPYDKAIGNGNYILHNFIGENDKLTAENIVDGTNHYLGKAETYLKDLATNWNESMKDRPAAQNYFANLITAVHNNNSFNTWGFDEAVSIMSANAKTYFADIIKNLDNEDDRYAFYTAYRILANESYKEGLGSYRQYSSSQMDKYEEEKATLTDAFYSEYGKDNFVEPTEIMDAVLDNAVTNMNNNGQGVNIKVEDLRQLINLSITTNSLAAMHDVTKYNLQHNQCSMSLGINVAISNAITETQQSQSQEMGL